MPEMIRGRNFNEIFADVRNLKNSIHNLHWCTTSIDLFYAKHRLWLCVTVILSFVTFLVLILVDDAIHFLSVADYSI